MIILGIETSCDETAAAIIEIRKKQIKVLSNIIASQINIHKKYGGIVPEVAAREHIINIIPVINEALKKAKIKNTVLRRPKKTARPQNSINRLASSKIIKKLDVIAVTIGPGLITSLQTGVETAKTLAYAGNIPITGVNHIEGHIYANFINEKLAPKNQGNKIFPAIILTVSGGHTKLVLMKNHGQYKTIGDTRDDAAGEAFDKAAKLMKLGYPGGPEIAAKATQSANKLKEDPKLKRKNPALLPRPMINSASFDFSFSGLKTALLYAIQKDKKWKEKIPNYCFEFQQAIIDVLIAKTIKAAKKFQVKSIMLSGGVSANKELRSQFKKAAEKHFPGCQLLIPNSKYSTDNAVMIALAGYFHALKNSFTPWQKLKADPNLELT